MPLIEVEGLDRTFTVRRKVSRFRRETHDVRAVRDLSFTVEAGEMVGYIGPNGAGKSTTIKMLTGILVPTSGHLRVAGVDRRSFVIQVLQTKLMMVCGHVGERNTIGEVESAFRWRACLSTNLQMQFIS